MGRIYSKAETCPAPLGNPLPWWLCRGGRRAEGRRLREGWQWLVEKVLDSVSLEVDQVLISWRSHGKGSKDTGLPSEGGLWGQQR